MLLFPFFFTKQLKAPKTFLPHFHGKKDFTSAGCLSLNTTGIWWKFPPVVSRAQTHRNTPSRTARPTHPCSCDLTLTHIYSPPPPPRQYNTDLVLWPHSDTVMCIHPSPLNLTYTWPYTPHTASRRPCVSCICKEPCACTLTYSHPLSLQARPQGPPPSLIHHAFRRSPKTWCPDLTTLWL